MAAPEHNGLLLSYEAGNQSHRYGGRVYADGRYELSTTDDPAWTAFDPFTDEQLERIEAAIDDVKVPDHIEGTRALDGDSATFTLKGRTVKVDDWPRGAPQLAALLDLIRELRAAPPVPSTWRVWNRDAVVTLEVPCDIADVPALSGLRDALFMPSASGRARGFADPPAGTPLVSVDFGPDETLEVYPDGRQRDADGEHRVDDDRLNAIRAALAARDWAKLPKRLC